MLAAVVRVPNDAAIPDGPAVLRIDETDVGQSGVALRGRVGRPLSRVLCWDRLARYADRLSGGDG